MIDPAALQAAPFLALLAFAGAVVLAWAIYDGEGA